jgi:hypothetical protein
VHDPRHDGSKLAVGHFYALNLRTHTLRHLAAGEGLHEHDMSALKRIKPKGLRQGVPKEAQALMIAMTHNLLLAYEHDLEQRHDLTNTAEDQRRRQRVESAGRACAEMNWPMSSLLLVARRATQRSLKFIRWLRHAIRDRLAESVAVARLRELYAVL